MHFLWLLHTLHAVSHNFLHNFLNSRTRWNKSVVNYILTKSGARVGSRKWKSVKITWWIVRWSSGEKVPISIYDQQKYQKQFHFSQPTITLTVRLTLKLKFLYTNENNFKTFEINDLIRSTTELQLRRTTRIKKRLQLPVLYQIDKKTELLSRATKHKNYLSRMFSENQLHCTHSY